MKTLLPAVALAVRFADHLLPGRRDDDVGVSTGDMQHAERDTMRPSQRCARIGHINLDNWSRCL